MLEHYKQYSLEHHIFVFSLQPTKEINGKKQVHKGENGNREKPNQIRKPTTNSDPYSQVVVPKECETQGLEWKSEVKE